MASQNTQFLAAIKTAESLSIRNKFVMQALGVTAISNSFDYRLESAPTVEEDVELAGTGGGSVVCFERVTAKSVRPGLSSWLWVAIFFLSPL
jgi:hypothetical protein